MTVIAVLADPPREGLVLPELPETSPLSTAEATELYAAMLKDTFAAVENSGGELLVNYRPDDQLPDHDGESSQAQLRALANEALDDVGAARFEQQVGSTFAARAGNTATHLLEREGVQSVAVVEGTTPMLTRKDLDSAAMKLRRSEVVLGPADAGRTFFLGLTDPIDFEGAYAAPSVETLANRATDAGHDVDFLPRMTAVETGTDLLSLVPYLNARVTADRIVPVHTTTYLHDIGLRVEERDGEPTLVR